MLPAALLIPHAMEPQGPLQRAKIMKIFLAFLLNSCYNNNENHY